MIRRAAASAAPPRRRAAAPLPDACMRVPPQELQKCAVGVTPGPQAAYAIKGFFGPKPPVTHEKAPTAFMGTDARDSAELREMKAQDLFPPVVSHG